MSVGKWSNPRTFFLLSWRDGFAGYVMHDLNFALDKHCLICQCITIPFLVCVKVE